MQFLDFSPPTTPTLEQQRDALQKSLGRVAQWAKEGMLDEEPLLAACLHDQRFDPQCEDNRGAWLWMLVNLAGKVDRFRDLILNALQTVFTEQDASQLCELALQFAQSGDPAFRRELFEFVAARRFPDARQIGEGQLISLGGEEALCFILRLRGRRLIDNDWEWDDDAVVEHALATLGEPRVFEVLNDSAEPEIQRFAALWRENRSLPGQGRQSYEARQARLRLTTAKDVICAALTGDQSFPFRGWGMVAPEDALTAVLNHLWQETAPEAIVRLLKAFSNRPLPVFDSRLIDFTRSSNAEVRRWALLALEKNAHQLVREFALQELYEPTLGVPVVGLFIENFQSGDEQLLLDRAELPADSWQRHGMLMDLVKVLENHEGAQSRELGQIAYFHTPCSSCRFHAARLLHTRRSAPDWLWAECQSDANEECRELGKSQAQ